MEHCQSQSIFSLVGLVIVTGPQLVLLLLQQGPLLLPLRDPRSCVHIIDQCFNVRLFGRLLCLQNRADPTQKIISPHDATKSGSQSLTTAHDSAGPPQMIRTPGVLALLCSQAMETS